MAEREFLNRAERAGFSPEQAGFMWEFLAKFPHKHTSDEIVIDTADGETLAQYIDYMDADDSDESEDED
jgi:hypothetical protein